MFVEGCRPGLAPGVSGIHFAVLSSNIATAQERTCHEGRRGGVGRRRRAPMEKGRVTRGRSDRDAHWEDESEGRQEPRADCTDGQSRWNARFGPDDLT